jgi:protein transport protein SEC13
LDYYGRRLATASSDRTIKIFDVAQDGSQSMIADIPAHEGPVWRISWAHPKFGNLLASCSYDKKVAIWREQGPDQYGNAQWVKVYEKMFDSSVGAVSWAPPEFGLALAAGIADGKIAVISFVENNWQVKTPSSVEKYSNNLAIPFSNSMEIWNIPRAFKNSF